MDVVTAVGLSVQLTGLALDLMEKAQQAGAIVKRSQEESRAFTSEELAALRALDDAARAAESAAIARAAAASVAG